MKNKSQPEYQPVRFMSCDGEEHHDYLRRVHKKAIDLCRRHHATLDLASSDIDVYVENCSEELAKKLQNFYFSRSNGNPIGITWEGKNYLRIY